MTAFWQCIECADFRFLSATENDKKMARYGLGKCAYDKIPGAYASALFQRNAASCEHGLTPEDAATVAKRLEWMEKQGRQYGKDAQKPV